MSDPNTPIPGVETLIRTTKESVLAKDSHSLDFLTEGQQAVARDEFREGRWDGQDVFVVKYSYGGYDIFTEKQWLAEELRLRAGGDADAYPSFQTSDEQMAFNDACIQRIEAGDPDRDFLGIWFAARAWFGRDTNGEKSEGTLAVNPEWIEGRKVDIRITSLQTAVAISQRSAVTSTETILKQAKTIENYLLNGSVDVETPDPAMA